MYAVVLHDLDLDLKFEDLTVYKSADVEVCMTDVYRCVLYRGDIRLHGGSVQPVHQQGVRCISHQVRTRTSGFRRQTCRFQRYVLRI